jgi:hypothetical protein
MEQMESIISNVWLLYVKHQFRAGFIDLVLQSCVEHMEQNLYFGTFMSLNFKSNVIIFQNLYIIFLKFSRLKSLFEL